MSTLLCRTVDGLLMPIVWSFMRVHVRTLSLCHFVKQNELSQRSVRSVVPITWFRVVHVFSLSIWIYERFFQRREYSLIEDLSKVPPKSSLIWYICRYPKISSLPIEHLGLVAFLLVESDLRCTRLWHRRRYIQPGSPFFFALSRYYSPDSFSKASNYYRCHEWEFSFIFPAYCRREKPIQAPPFTQMVTIHISDWGESRQTTYCKHAFHLWLRLQKNTRLFALFYDHLLTEKRVKYCQKILVRCPNMLAFSNHFRAQLVRGGE